jgi:hypothetical protein
VSKAEFARPFYWDDAEAKGTSDAVAKISQAKKRADAFAARLLAERECPNDLIEWGRAHGIANFAEATWMAGFAAGMRVAALDKEPK